MLKLWPEKPQISLGFIPWGTFFQLSVANSDAKRHDFALQFSKSVPQRLKPSSARPTTARLKQCPSSRVSPNLTNVPQGLKPILVGLFTARLKSCPDTKHQSFDSRKTRATQI